MSTSKDYETFAERYKTEEQEILVLLSDGGGGAAKTGGLWSANAYFLAWQDTVTGQLHKGDGRVVWPVSEEERKAHGVSYPYFFKKEKVYRLLARDLKDRTVPEGHLPSAYNNFMVVKVLEEDVQSPQLAEVLEEYLRPVVVNDPDLGGLTLNKRYASFEGHVDWLGRGVSVMLDVDPDDQDTWTAAFGHMRTLLAEQTSRDESFRAFAAQKLTRLANDWAEDDQGEITPEDFIRRIRLSEISMDDDGKYCMFYNDDDMFLGHIITIYGTVNGHMESANIEG